MAGLVMKQLLVVALVIASANVNAQPIKEKGQDGRFAVKPVLLSLQSRSIYDQYTLGQKVDGAQIIYTNQYTQSYETNQPEITLDFSYPLSGDNADNTKTITEVTLYLEAADGASTQAYVTEGGIGETSITLQMVAKNSDSLRYMVVIYGKQM